MFEAYEYNENIINLDTSYYTLDSTQTSDYKDTLGAF
jgi:hypothetical protein